MFHRWDGRLYEWWLPPKSNNELCNCTWHSALITSVLQFSFAFHYVHVTFCMTLSKCCRTPDRLALKLVSAYLIQIDHLHLFPCRRKNSSKQKNIHKLFDLLKVGALKLSDRLLSIWVQVVYRPILAMFPHSIMELNISHSVNTSLTVLWPTYSVIISFFVRKLDVMFSCNSEINILTKGSSTRLRVSRLSRWRWWIDFAI